MLALRDEVVRIGDPARPARRGPPPPPLRGPARLPPQPDAVHSPLPPLRVEGPRRPSHPRHSLRQAGHRRLRGGLRQLPGPGAGGRRLLRGRRPAGPHRRGRGRAHPGPGRRGGRLRRHRRPAQRRRPPRLEPGLHRLQPGHPRRGPARGLRAVGPAGVLLPPRLERRSRCPTDSTSRWCSPPSAAPWRWTTASPRPSSTAPPRAGSTASRGASPTAPATSCAAPSSGPPWSRCSGPAPPASRLRGRPLPRRRRCRRPGGVLLGDPPAAAPHPGGRRRHLPRPGRRGWPPPGSASRPATAPRGTGAPDIARLYAAAEPAVTPAGVAPAPGSSIALREQLGKVLGHLNQASGGAILIGAADLLDSTAISAAAAGFPPGFFHLGTNPGSRTLSVGGICEDGLSCVLSGVSAFGQHAGAGASYGAFLSPLGHIAARLHAIGNQMRPQVEPGPSRPFVLICGHAGMKTGEDGPTHADPQALQLLQENFAPGHGDHPDPVGAGRGVAADRGRLPRPAGPDRPLRHPAQGTGPRPGRPGPAPGGGGRTGPVSPARPAATRRPRRWCCRGPTWPTPSCRRPFPGCGPTASTWWSST